MIKLERLIINNTRETKRMGGIISTFISLPVYGKKYKRALPSDTPLVIDWRFPLPFTSHFPYTIINIK